MKDKDETSMLLNEAYSCFYKAYDRINRIAWNGSLPECSFWFYEDEEDEPWPEPTTEIRILLFST